MPKMEGHHLVLKAGMISFDIISNVGTIKTNVRVENVIIICLKVTNLGICTQTSC